MEAHSMFDEKTQKYVQVTLRNSCKFVPAVFYHTGQMHHGIMALIRPQIDYHKLATTAKPMLIIITNNNRHKLIPLEDEAKQSKIKSTMKWWSKCISMVIAKTTSRNVAFKAGKIIEAVFETQTDFVPPEVGG